MSKRSVGIWNENFNRWNNFNSDGDTWIVLGNTFEIKEELKKRGAKFNRELGWHFDHEESDYQTYKINMKDITDTYEDGRLHFVDNVYCIVEQIKKIHTVYEPSNSDWLGEIGKKLFVQVHLTSVRHLANAFSSVVYEFEDEDENIIVWITSSNVEFDKEHDYWIDGVVKDHNEFNGEKQTRLVRVKIRNIEERK